ncbi:MAG: gamma-glutamyltransferase [Rhodospirillales bacterium]|nr:gamma-glutamyltransferase [Rhodospirillales bacterium]MDP6841645.1 gamma-glutamyltransferase [Rhodospirillales bacterium]
MHTHINEGGIDLAHMDGHRPLLRGRRHMAVAGHYLAAQAALQILEAGGNAIDAGVAGGIALGVVQSQYVNVAGVAPIMIYLGAEKRVETISGLGPWPRALTPELFQRDHGGHIPEGVLRTVVPAAPDAWITALARHGTMAFAEVAAAAIRFAAEGFVMYPHMAQIITEQAEGYGRWPSSATIYLPGGEPPRVGDIFAQTDLAASLQYMADEEQGAAKGGREAGLEAARAAFYRGDIAAAIVRYHRENDGLLSADDLAEYRSAVEAPVRATFEGIDVYTCGPWCQGPVLLQALSLLRAEELRAFGQNSLDYAHTVTEALKLAFADRERHYGDPRFVDVPLDHLLSAKYCAAQRRRIVCERALVEGAAVPAPDEPAAARDTSYIAVIDRHGNAFSATPSDVSYDTPVIPGTGLCPSSRGSQSWANPEHASGVAPGKRPRLTPNPALAIHEGHFIMPFGTPGSDVQCQAMLQAFLNIVLFGMNPQAAVEAPRFATYDFPASFEPHTTYPGRLNLEGRFPEATGRALAARGHDIHAWPDWTYLAGAVCMVYQDLERGTLAGAADPRRQGYAAGW